MSASTPDGTDLYRQLNEYNWDNDPEFQVGALFLS